jgi:transposase-like protein
MSFTADFDTDWTADELADATTPMVGEDKAASTPPGKHSSIPRARWLEVARAIVTGSPTQAQIARRFDITRSAVTQWKKRHRGPIEQVRASIDTEFSAVYLSEKLTRLWSLQPDFELSTEQPNAASPDHIRVRMALLRAIAEELGALPPRTSVMVVPVQARTGRRRPRRSQVGPA